MFQLGFPVNAIFLPRPAAGCLALVAALVLCAAAAQAQPAVDAVSPAPAGQPEIVMTRDASNNLWFFVRDAAGEEVLAPAIIGGGDAIASAWVLHDGNDYVVVWLAKVGGFEQAFGQRVTCE